MIEVKNLKKKYSRGKEIIKDLNISFKETGLNIICGKSGCGKTTLINILGSMDRNFDGEVIIDGLNIHDASYEKIADYRNFTSAFVFQKNSLFEFLTVKENLDLCLNIQNSNANISDALDKVGLHGFENKKVKALSGGEKQRVAIARALIKDSKIIFADEPTSALDSKNAHMIFKLFKELSKDRLVIMVTHDVKKATLYADRLVRLVDGNIEEDVTYHDVSSSIKTLNKKSSKPFALFPIWRHNLKTGMLVNIFVILLLSIGLIITNIALEQKYVKDEYDSFSLEQENFNVDRAIETHIRNNIDLYKIVKRNEADDPYYYLKHAYKGDSDISEGDYHLLTSNLKNYKLYEGTNDIQYEKLIIDHVSQKLLLSYEVTSSERYTWYQYIPSNYVSYTYDKNNDYKLEIGRLPESDNEILVTDTVAYQYLANRAYNPGLEYLPENKYVVDFNDIISDDYIAHYTIYGAGRHNASEGDQAVVENDFVIYDSYGKQTNNLVGEKTYYQYVDRHYKVVGVIKTGLLDYYTYNVNYAKYYLLDNMITQNGKEEYMNSLYNQPFGYVVIPNGLPSTNENVFSENPFAMDRIMSGDIELNNKVLAFTGRTDITGHNMRFYGWNDDLQVDHNNRLLCLSTENTKLKDDEIIISKNMAIKLFSHKDVRNNNVVSKYDSFKGEIVSLDFYSDNEVITKEFKVVGLCDNIDNINGNIKRDFYVSDEAYKELYIFNKGTNPTLTIDLNDKTLLERKILMKKLYKLGYCLEPIDQMPGAYLEMVENKGEMIAQVDYDGLVSLYPNFVTENIDGKSYFIVDGTTFGYIEGAYVYMTSSMVRKILLDDSYYTSQGNISPYYLYSIYYNSTNAGIKTLADGGNSLLDIINGLYQFFIAMAIILSLGFIILKEYRQSDIVTKLSMLGVRNKDLIRLNLVTYIPMMILILVLGFGGSAILINVINKMYDIHFVDSEAVIRRVRLLFTESSAFMTILSTIILSVMIVSITNAITLKHKK